MMLKRRSPGPLLAILLGGCAAPEITRTQPIEASYADPLPAPLRFAAAPQDTVTRGLGTTRVMLGQEQLDSDFWDPIDQQWFLQVETAFESKSDWFGGEIGCSYTNDKDETGIVDPVNGPQDLKVELRAFEGYFGLHRTFLRDAAFRPYVGTGVSFFYYDAQKNTDGPGVHIHDDDEGGFAFGAYAHGGLSLQLSENVQIGLDLRVLGFTDVDDLGGDGDLDYERVSVFVGFGG